MSNHPPVQPIKILQVTSKQSKYEMCARLPFRSCILGPSGSGKTILLQNMILQIYKLFLNNFHILNINRC